MPEEQQQAAAPAANDTKTSWSFGDFAKGLGSPLTKNEDGSYNVAGALLTGAGSGLVTWVLSRMLGIKSGPSLGISILAALAGTHGAFTKQGGLDFFSNPKGYLKDFMDQKRVSGDQPAPQEKSVEDNMSKEDAPQGPVPLMPENKLERNLVGEPPANLNMEEIEAGKTRPLMADKGRSEYMNMIRNGMVTPEAHRRAIENGIKKNPSDPYVQQLIDAYGNRTDLNNAAEKARWVDVLTNKRLAAASNLEKGKEDPFGKADEDMYKEIDAAQSRYSDSNTPLTGGARGIGNVNPPAMIIPGTPSARDIAEHQALQKASQQAKEQAQNEAMRKARLDLWHQDTLREVQERANQINEAKKNQAMADALRKANKEVAMQESLKYWNNRQKPVQLNAPVFNPTPGPETPAIRVERPVPGAYSATHLGGGAADNWDNQQLSSVPAPISKQVPTGLPPIRFRRNMNPAYAIQSVLHPDTLQTALNNQ